MDDGNGDSQTAVTAGDDEDGEDDEGQQQNATGSESSAFVYLHGKYKHRYLRTNAFSAIVERFSLYFLVESATDLVVRR